VKSAKPKVRSVLLDASFVNSLLATDSPDHVDAVALYETLVDRYQSGLDRLFALSTVLGDLPKEFRRQALAPVLMARVAGQHRRAARKVTGTATPDIALSLVMMRRERIHTVATAISAFDELDVTVLHVTEPHDTTADIMAPHTLAPHTMAPHTMAPHTATAVERLSSRTEPLLAPRSTAE
jgi:hypothetical protein